MSVLTVIKKIGDKIISVVEWPFKRAEQIEAILQTAQTDFPATEEAIIGAVKQLETIGEDGLTALAEKGLNIPDDLQLSADVKAFFAYVKTNLFPIIETDFAALKADAQPAQSTAALAPTLTAATDPASTVADPASSDTTDSDSASTAGPPAAATVAVSGAPLAAD